VHTLERAMKPLPLRLMTTRGISLKTISLAVPVGISSLLIVRGVSGRLLFGRTRNFDTGYAKEIRVVVPRKARDVFNNCRLSIFKTSPWSGYVFAEIMS
jgi:hypothetical protein